jgi:hypothetical protein
VFLLLLKNLIPIPDRAIKFDRRLSHDRKQECDKQRENQKKSHTDTMPGSASARQSKRFQRDLLGFRRHKNMGAQATMAQLEVLVK